MREFRSRPVRSRWRWPLAVLLVVVCLVPATLAVSLAFSTPTISYRISAGRLELRGGESLLASQRSIPLAQIVASEQVTLQHGRRVAGTGLPGLCAGHFRYDGLGDVWQVTDCRRQVLLLRVVGEERPVLVSPGDPAAFLAAVAAGRDVDLSPPPVVEPFAWRLFKVAMAVMMVPLVAYVVAALAAAPRRLRYRVGDGVLEVQLLIWRRRFSLPGSTASRYTPRRAWKTAGSAMPGYYAGCFRVDGAATRVYASTVRDEGVMVDGERRVFVTPADLVDFLAELRRNGAMVADEAATAATRRG